MNHHLELGENIFRVEEPLQTERGATPPRLIPTKNEVYLADLSGSSLQVQEALDRLRTNCLWILSPNGFNTIGLRCGPIASNGQPNLNTTIHTHFKSPLDVTFTARGDCTRLPLELFSNGAIESFFRLNWKGIKELTNSNEAPEFHYFDETRIFGTISRAWDMACSFFRFIENSNQLLDTEDTEERDLYISIFFSTLPHLWSEIGVELRRQANEVKADQVVPWGLPKIPSAAVFRGFHRGGIQAADEKALIFNASLTRY